MDSAMIAKIEKAKRYAEERQKRIAFQEFKVTVQGNHKPHNVSYSQGQWACDCSFFSSRRVCSHTMALERVLGGVIPSPQEETVPNIAE